MARDAEKAKTALGKFYRSVMDEKRGFDERRPHRTTDCTDVRKAEKWRRDVMREISKKVSEIQNAGLGEFRLRDLNDEINKLLRELTKWQERIVQLGGRDYRMSRTGPKLFSRDGDEVPGNRGYRYFGATRELPGVKEMLTKIPQEVARKTRGELAKHVDPHYFGYLDEDDGEILPLEAQAEEKFFKKVEKEWQKKHEDNWTWLDLDDLDDDENKYMKLDLRPADDDADSAADVLPDVTPMVYDEGSGKNVEDVDVVTQSSIEQALIRQRKAELLERYASRSLAFQSEEAKTLFGFEDQAQ